MLVLTRCPGRGDQSTICIAHGVEITVVAIEGDQIHLTLTAPPPVMQTVTLSPDLPAQKRLEGRPRKG